MFFMRFLFCDYRSPSPWTSRENCFLAIFLVFGILGIGVYRNFLGFTDFFWRNRNFEFLWKPISEHQNDLFSKFQKKSKSKEKSKEKSKSKATVLAWYFLARKEAPKKSCSRFKKKSKQKSKEKFRKPKKSLKKH